MISTDYGLQTNNYFGVVDSDGRIAWFSSRSPRVRFPLTSLRRAERDATTEVTRRDEDTVLKTAGGVIRLWVRVPRLPLDKFNHTSLV